MSGAVDLPYRTAPAPPPPARAAGAASVLLGLLLLTELPGVWRAAAYLGVLTATFAACALVAGAWLWRRGDLSARATAGGVAVLTFAGEMLNLVLGVPGARTLERPDGSSGLLAFVLEIGVVLLLALDAASRQPEPEPEHPYAL
ncbi:hypothetical protein K1X13_04725 [Nocardioides sp. WL0053]|uniref:Uncharacterized protein n=1 Tax=Nocardioides jiangsuensis TaxID=2866161 RepID=A0ABS7RHY7_9ACTN|nr:hypothetical protein [Nocardioides jiangsuensis]MBY9074124.1 hypothetical protein [Nocardioides jiangsuensis]